MDDDYVVTIDPGTRNLALCLMRYKTGPDPPATVEEFLTRISLVKWLHNDFNTTHIPTVSMRFKKMVESSPWLTEHPADIIIEQQGSRTSPITFFAFSMHGYFLGVYSEKFRDTPRTHYINYPAANKFRGPWVNVCGDLGSLASESVDDPVKRAAVCTLERMLNYISVPDGMLDEARAARRQHDLCDTVLQGVSWLYRKHKLDLDCESPYEGDETIGSILKQPRKGRKRARQTNTTIKLVKVKKQKPAREILVGKNGGKYYLAQSGKKVYVK